MIYLPWNTHGTLLASVEHLYVYMSVVSERNDTISTSINSTVRNTLQAVCVYAIVLEMRQQEWGEGHLLGC